VSITNIRRLKKGQPPPKMHSLAIDKTETLKKRKKERKKEKKKTQWPNFQTTLLTECP
jgi:hypothetical protein